MDRQAPLSADRQRLLELRLKRSGGRSPESRQIPRRAEGQRLPLSFGQHQLWTIDQMSSGNTAYNIPIAYRIRGELDLRALEESFNHVINRHESWRTTFRECDGEPEQEIHPECKIQITTTDLAHLPAGDREAKFCALASEEVSKPFDLRQLPLLRVSLFKLGRDEHVLLINLHHIICDAWSCAILARELTSLYAAFRSGLPNPLPGLPLQFGDYALWQREKCAGAAMASHLAFWCERLGGERAPIPVPADRPRPARQSQRGGVRTRELPSALASKLRELARAEGVTLFILTLAAFKALLARYSGETDLCIGSPIAQRPNVETERLIGFFLNMLALRSDVSGDPDFRELLRRVRATVLDAFQHQEVPFEKIVEELHPSRGLSHQPIFQIAFVLLPSDTTVPTFAGATVISQAVPITTAKFDLTLFIEETGEGMRAMMEYSADQFDATTADRMLESLELLLEGIVEDPSTPLSQLPILGAEQRERILTEWSGSERPYPKEQTIAARFAECAARTPAAIAVIEDGQRLTYSEIDARANRVAHLLQSRGVRAGDFVGLRAERSLAFVVKVLGITKAGAAYMPLDEHEPPARLASMQAACATVLDAEPDGDFPATPATSSAIAEGPAYVLFTSGSTGAPKGVIVPHRGVTRLVVNNDYAPFQPDDVVAFASNVCFDAATFEIWGALLNGAALVITPRDVVLSPFALEGHLSKHHVSVLFLTTSLFNRLAHESPAMFRGLRILVFGGEQADAESVRLVLAHGRPQRLVNGYGPTETTTFAICHTITEVAGSSVPIGHPIANTRVFLLDASLQPVPVGVAGEICIGGPGVALGYHGAPEPTAEKFIATEYGRLYRTGDLARWRPDGTIECLGRMDQQLKLRGFRIELGEIEAALRQLDSLKEAAVVLREDVPGEKRLVAYLVSKSAAPTSLADVRSNLKARLPDYMIPGAFVFLDALPLSANGKLERNALPAPAPNGNGLERPFVAAQTEFEKRIAAIWQDILKTGRVGIHDNFFELGGDSLSAMQVISRLRNTGFPNLNALALFERPTIAELVTALPAASEDATREEGVL
ncbi:MAG: condensation domain-containing protein [Chthoniobacteraceae bacterium]